MTEAGELRELAEFGVNQIVLPTNPKETFKGTYAKEDREEVTLSGGKYQNELTEETTYPTADIIPPDPNNFPGRELKLGGSVSLITVADFWFLKPSIKDQLFANAHSFHQATNDAKVAQLVERIRAREFELKDGTVELDKAAEADEVRQTLVANEERLMVQVLDFKVTEFIIKVREELLRTTEAQHKVHRGLNLEYVHPELRDITARIDMATTIKHDVRKIDDELKIFPKLLQLHQATQKRHTEELAQRMESGELALGKSGVTLNSKAELTQCSSNSMVASPAKKRP